MANMAKKKEERKENFLGEFQIVARY